LEFYRHFANDGLKPVEKPIDPFANKEASNDLLKDRTEYDEYILYADKAFGQLYNSLEKSGLLENTWVVFTSDHGEMFERGLVGHGNPTLYQPLIRIPLLIFEPGQKTGSNIHTSTSAIDVMPTLLHLTGQNIPDWVEGSILPPYTSASPDASRNIYAITAKKNGQYQPFTNASATLVKERYKLIYCFGYPKVQGEIIQLFDIQSDPEELKNLYSSNPNMAEALLTELKAKLAEVDKPYL
jgi:arylsulfatase A-like enzyme